jgi:hypothetical protein
MTSTTTPQTAQPARRRTRTQGPFPVVIIRPASTALPSYLREHRGRQRAANQLAADLTAQWRSDLPPSRWFVNHIGLNLDDPHDHLMWLPDGLDVRDIIRQARVLAPAPPPGAVRIGRDWHARPIVVVLHAPQWSLVLHRAHPYPAAWVLLGDNELSLCLDGTRELSIEWDEMSRDVYTTLTGDTG